MTIQETAPEQSTLNRRRGLFRFLIVGVQVAFFLVAAEVALRWKSSHVRESDRIDPGFAQYDAELGWVLSPSWTGGHRGPDFAVRYTIDELGFRDDSPHPARHQGKLVAVVGDSFTFGFGVNADQTFVHLLNQRFTNQITFVNFGVPGYSTDQEFLLLEREILKWKPDLVLLMVYLANDLFDNQLSYPLQFSFGKPYFELGANGLELKNVPVPRAPKPPEVARLNLMTQVLGGEARTGLRYRFERRSELFRVLAELILPERDRTTDFDARFAPAAALFSGILDRIQRACVEHGARLVVGILAGRSFVEEPKSISAQYQERLRQMVLKGLLKPETPVIDLATALRRGKPRGAFYPNDGHLTSEGHRQVARILSESAALKEH